MRTRICGRRCCREDPVTDELHELMKQAVIDGEAEEAAAKTTAGLW